MGRAVIYNIAYAVPAFSDKGSGAIQKRNGIVGSPMLYSFYGIFRGRRTSEKKVKIVPKGRV
jgi:hypothetical protein